MGKRRNKYFLISKSILNAKVASFKIGVHLTLASADLPACLMVVGLQHSLCWLTSNLGPNSSIYFCNPDNFK